MCLAVFSDDKKKDIFEPSTSPSLASSIAVYGQTMKQRDGFGVDKSRRTLQQSDVLWAKELHVFEDFGLLSS